MEGLLSFILFGAVFYFVMRIGCGAHMVHGGHGDHGGHGGGGHDHGQSKSDVGQVDPVCGMKVDEKKGYGKMHQGTLFRFCSKSCLEKFDADPTRYLKSEGGE